MQARARKNETAGTFPRAGNVPAGSFCFCVFAQQTALHIVPFDEYRSIDLLMLLRS